MMNRFIRFLTQGLIGLTLYGALFFALYDNSHAKGGGSGGHGGGGHASAGHSVSVAKPAAAKPTITITTPRTAPAAVTATHSSRCNEQGKQTNQCR